MHRFATRKDEGDAFAYSHTTDKSIGLFVDSLAELGHQEEFNEEDALASMAEEPALAESEIAEPQAPVAEAGEKLHAFALELPDATTCTVSVAEFTASLRAVEIPPPRDMLAIFVRVDGAAFTASTPAMTPE